MRTDIHCPTHFDPAAYTYVGSFDNWPEPGAFLNRAADPWSDYTTAFGVVSAMTYEHAEYLGGRRLLEAEGVASGHWANGNQCDHCGARIRYVAIYRHANGECIAVGNDCAANRFSCADRREYDIKTLKERAATARERIAAFGKALTFLEATAPELVQWMLSPAAETVHPIFLDMSRRLVQWGSLSEKQVAFAQKLLRERYERERNGGKTDREVKWAEEKEAAADCPTGRVVVTGTVVKSELRESQWGTVCKLVVKDDTGFAVWMTCPSSLDVEKGDRIQVTVTLERSEKDAKFGFGSRPAKGKKL